MSMHDDLKSITEDQLRTKIVEPLLYVLGCSYVISNHGKDEKGKDLLYRTKNIYGQDIWGAVLLKNDCDINSSSTGSFAEVKRQTEQAINSKFIDPERPTHELPIDELTIMTTYKVKHSAITDIKDQAGRNFPRVFVVQDGQLVSIINRHVKIFNQVSSDPYNFGIDTFAGFCDEFQQKIGKPEAINSSSGLSVIGTTEGEIFSLDTRT